MKRQQGKKLGSWLFRLCSRNGWENHPRIYRATGERRPSPRSTEHVWRRTTFKWSIIKPLWAVHGFIPPALPEVRWFGRSENSFY